jgi:DNA-binding CsgD family transcriptional regulator
MRASAVAILDRPDRGRREQAVAPRFEAAAPHGRAAPGDDLPAFSALVGEVYDAALDPARWPAVLGKVRDFVGGSAVSLISKDAATKDFCVYYQCGNIDPYYVQLYAESYAGFDPSTTAHVLAEIEQPICFGDFMTYEELLETRIYKEWARPQGLVDFMSVVLDRSGTGAAICGVFRSEREGICDDDMRWRMRQLAPHIRRAVLVGRAIELKTTEAASFGAVLDGLSAGMFLVDSAGRIVHANASGHAMLSEADALRVARGRLIATDLAAARALNEIFAAAGEGDAALGNRGIAVPLPGRDGVCYAAHVLPLTSGLRRRAAASHAAAAAVFVRKADIALPSPPEAMARHYGLTPTELRVLLAIVQIGGVPETAEALGIGESTVKTHLHRLFGKTGTARQADLVRLVAGFASPLAA